MDDLTVFGKLLKPWIHAFMSAVSDFIPTKKITGKKLPALDHKWNHPRFAYWPSTIEVSKYRELRAKAKTLISESLRFTSAHLTQISRGSLNAFGPFLSSRIKRGPSLKRWARAMTISRALKHQRLNRSPSCLTLTLCRSSLPPQRSALVSTFDALTPHIKWAGDPVGNGFDISQTAWYKQSNWMRLNLSAPAEVNRWPHRTVPDHVVQQIVAAWHFSGRLETREYCTHFQERKERLCGELSPYFTSPCHLQSSRALPSGGSTGSYIPPHQSQTARLFSRLILCDSAHITLAVNSTTVNK